jgi:hypothetical protein
MPPDVIINHGEYMLDYNYNNNTQTVVRKLTMNDREIINSTVNS